MFGISIKVYKNLRWIYLPSKCRIHITESHKEIKKEWINVKTLVDLSFIPDKELHKNIYKKVN